MSEAMRSLLHHATGGRSPEAYGWKHIKFPESLTRDHSLRAESFNYTDDIPDSLIWLLPNTNWPIEGAFVFDLPSVEVIDDHGAGLFNVLALMMFSAGRIVIKTYLGRLGQQKYKDGDYEEYIALVYHTPEGISDVSFSGLSGNALCRCMNIVAWCLDTVYQHGQVAPPRVDYHAYLQSDAWKAKRVIALERAEFRCQVCNSTDRLNVHHRTYERLGAELPEDLTVLCESCHKLFHDNGRLAK